MEEKEGWDTKRQQNAKTPLMALCMHAACRDRYNKPTMHELLHPRVVVVPRQRQNGKVIKQRMLQGRCSSCKGKINRFIPNTPKEQKKRRRPAAAA